MKIVCSLVLAALAFTAGGADSITPAANQEDSCRIADGGFEEGLTHWILKCHDGAEGKAEIVENGRHGKALKLTKLNGEGFLQLVSREPVPFQAGRKMTFRGFYRSENSPLSTLLLFRLTPSADDGRWVYDDIDRSFGFTSQSMLLNAAPGIWNKRVISRQSVLPEKLYCNILVVGNPVEVVLDDLELEPFSKFRRPQPADLEKRTTFPYTEEQVYEILAKRKAPEAFLEKRGAKVVMLLNGEEVPPVLYKSESYYDDYVYNRFTEFGEAGVPFVGKTVPLGQSRSLPGVVQAKGKYDFKRLDQLMMYVLRQDPQANIWLCWYCNEPYPGWGLAHKDELWYDQEGRFGYGTWGNCEGFTDDLAKARISDVYRKMGVKPWPFPSMSSDVYRDEIVQILTDLTEYVMKSPFRNAVAGFHIGGLHDGQFQFFNHDYGPAARKKFHTFLLAKYTTLENLNRAYGTSYRSFEEITIPERAIGERAAKAPFSAECLLADYRDFQLSETFGIKHQFADAVRRAAGKKVFVSAYGHPMEYQTETFLKHDDGGIDIYAVPSWYPFRLPGYPVGAKPDGGFALRGKIWLNEMDIRSWTEAAKGEMYDMWIGSMITPEWWKQANRKFAGISLAARQGWWYYSMYRYFDRPEVMADIKQLMSMTKRVLKAEEIPFRPDVCVVRTEHSDSIRSVNMLHNHVGFPIFYQMLEISGVPYDLHNLCDVLERKELQDYKMYIFADANYISSADREKLNALLKNGNRVLFFVDGAGYADDKGKSVEHLRDLTSFEISTKEEFGRATAIGVPGHPLNKGVPPFVSCGDLLYSTQAVRGPSPFSARYQVFSIEDAGEGEILARYHETGRTAAAIREHGTWTSVYSAGPYAVLPEFLNNLAAKYNCFRVAPAAQSIHMNGNFISIHGVRNGELPLTLPAGVCKVTDLDSGRVYVVPENGKITVDVMCGRSIWLLLEKE